MRKESKCQNPFHYLRRYDNLSNQRLTKCPCRNLVFTKKCIKINASQSSHSNFQSKMFQISPNQEKCFQEKSAHLRRMNPFLILEQMTLEINMTEVESVLINNFLSKRQTFLRTILSTMTNPENALQYSSH